MRYTFTHEGRTYTTVAGPAVATDSMSPDYPREMMAAHHACRICWRDIENGETVHELDTGYAVHEKCLDWAVFAIKTEAPPLAPQRRDIPAGPYSPWPRAQDIGHFRARSEASR